MIDEEEWDGFQRLIKTWKGFDFAHYMPEWEVNRFFIRFHKLLGFEKIRPSNGVGDYIGWRNGKPYIIELEGHSAAFWFHKPHIVAKIDYVICYRASSKDRQKLGSKLIEIRDYVEFMTKEVAEIYEIILQKLYVATLYEAIMFGGA
jgi:hypothetical protein